jgi:hypothetical protein
VESSGEAAASHPDAREALRGGIRGVARMYAAHRDVLRALNSMAQLDGHAVGGMAAQARRLADQGILRADVTVDATTDLLCLLTSFDSFDLLHIGRQSCGAADHRCRTQPVPMTRPRTHAAGGEELTWLRKQVRCPPQCRAEWESSKTRV